jgi:hypothetical protein
MEPRGSANYYSSKDYSLSKEEEEEEEEEEKEEEKSNKHMQLCLASSTSLKDMDHADSPPPQEE